MEKLYNEQYKESEMKSMTVSSWGKTKSFEPQFYNFV